MEGTETASITMAVIVGVAILGGIATASPDTTDCTDSQSTTNSDSIELADRTEDGGGGGTGNEPGDCFPMNGCPDPVEGGDSC